MKSGKWIFPPFFSISLLPYFQSLFSPHLLSLLLFIQPPTRFYFTSLLPRFKRKEEIDENDKKIFHLPPPSRSYHGNTSVSLFTISEFFFYFYFFIFFLIHPLFSILFPLSPSLFFIVFFFSFRKWFLIHTYSLIFFTIKRKRVVTSGLYSAQILR